MKCFICHDGKECEVNGKCPNCGKTSYTPKFTKKQYESLAQVLKDCKPTEYELSNEYTNIEKVLMNSAGKIQWQNDVEFIAFMLQSDNARFNKARFFSACGYAE